jgi:hypothetical protein
MNNYQLKWYSIDGFTKGMAFVSVHDDGIGYVSGDNIPKCVFDRADRCVPMGTLQGSAQDYGGPDVRGYEWLIIGMPENRTIKESDLSRKMEIFVDIKKVFSFAKHTGKWFWSDKDDKDNQHGPFDSFIAMVNDAIEPYEDEKE